MLDVIGAGATAKTDIDWHATWKKSRQYEDMQVQLQGIVKNGEKSTAKSEIRERHSSFPAPVKVQLAELLKRGYRNYFRSPPYLLSKYGTNIFAGKYVSIYENAVLLTTWQRLIYWIHVFQNQT